MSSVAPTLARPVISVAMNKSDFGAPITYPLRDDRYKSEQGRDTTSGFYKGLAEVAREVTGIDQAPEVWRTLLNGYVVGAPRIGVQAFIDNPNNARLGQAQRIPMVSQFYDNWNPYAMRSIFDAAVNDAMDVQRAVNSDPNTPQTDEQRKQLQWLADWKKTDNALKAEKSAVTKAKMAPDTTRARYNAIAVKRQKAEADAIYRWRTMQGLETERTGR